MFLITLLIVACGLRQGFRRRARHNRYAVLIEQNIDREHIEIIPSIPAEKREDRRLKIKEGTSHRPVVAWVEHPASVDVCRSMLQCGQENFAIGSPPNGDRSV